MAATDSAGSLERIAGSGVALSVRRRKCAEASGHGPLRRAVLLLHGWPGTNRDWALVFERLADNEALRHFELICPDLRGFGDSDKPAAAADADEPWAAYAPAAHVQDLLAVLDDVGIEETIVAGYDLGANLAQGLARAQPQRVSGLVLCDPVHAAARAQAATLDLAAELWYQSFHQLPWSADLVGYDRRTVEIYLRHFYTHWWGRGEVDEAHFQAVVDSYATPGAFGASIGWYRARGRSGGSAPAEPIRTSTRVLWGEARPDHADRARRHA